MGVVVDVFFAVAMIAVAAGAVTELQFRIAYIRASADGAAVGVRCLSRLRMLLIRCGKGNNFGPVGGIGGLALLFALQLHPQGQGEQQMIYKKNTVMMTIQWH